MRNRDDFVYEALSYCWGTDTAQENVWICSSMGDREKLEITCSLASALKSLRYEDRPRNLWIDQICINQQSHQEKSPQVMELMSQIYTNTTHLIIWLGDEDNDSELAMRTIKNTCDELRAQSGVLNWSKPDLFSFLKKQHGRIDFRPWVAVLRLLKRPWFTRMWTVQEYYLPTLRSIMVHCGNSQVKWKDLSYCHISISEHNWIQYTSPDTIRIDGFEDKDLEELVVSSNRPIPLEYFHNFITSKKMNDPSMTDDPGVFLCLSYFAIRQCRDPRDKIFALKHVLEEDPVAQNPRVDYNRTVTEVFTDIARRIMTLYKTRNVLAFCQPYGTCREFKLPSWVPDWTIIEERKPQRTLSTAWLGENRSLQVLPKSDPIILDSDDPAVLRLHGYRVETISTVGCNPNLYRPPRSEATVGLIHEIMEDAWSKIPGRAPLNCSPQKLAPLDWDKLWPLECPERQLFHALGRQIKTVIFQENNSWPSTEPLPECSQSDVDQLHELISRARDIHKKGATTTNGPIDYNTATQVMSYLLPPELDPYPEDKVFWTTLAVGEVSLSSPKEGFQTSFTGLEYILPGRQFFTTTNNTTMGLGPYHIQPGDAICLFPGAEVPFVLRRAVDAAHWIMMGECYCHAYMDGSLGERIVKERELEEFCIK